MAENRKEQKEFFFIMMAINFIREVMNRIATNTQSTLAQPFPKKQCVVIGYEGVLASVAWRDRFLEGDKPNWELYWKGQEYDPVIPEIKELIAAIDEEVPIIVICNHRPAFSSDIRSWMVKNGVTAPTRIITRYYGDESFDLIRKRALEDISRQYTVALIIEADPSAVEMERALGYEVRAMYDPHIDPPLKSLPYKYLPPDEQDAMDAEMAAYQGGYYHGYV